MTGRGIIGKPNLIISSLFVSSSAGAGSTLNVHESTKNIGPATAGASTTSLYLSSDPDYDPSDIYLNSRTLPSLAAGEVSSGSTQVTIPAGWPAGPCYIIAVADANGEILEYNEANNTKSRLLMILPDLIVSTLLTRSSAGAGSILMVAERTKNIGPATAGASTTSLYLSTDPDYDPSDIYLNSRTVPSLAAGEVSSGSTQVTIPAGWPAGPGYLIAVADANGDLPEYSEVNNYKSRLITITSP